MLNISMRELLEVGVHFGHQARRWNPKMAPYIYSEKNGIHIIDLSITLEKLSEAYEFVKGVAEMGGDILFVGTKKQARESVKEEAVRAGVFYVTHRWLGGMLTNFHTIRNNLDTLEKLIQIEEDGSLDALPRKEAMIMRKKKEKLEKILSGIRGMNRLPSMLYVVDPKNENIAVLEARKLGIPIVAIVDTNCDPDLIDYIIPGNDDAIKAIRLITSIMADAVIEGRGLSTEGNIPQVASVGNDQENGKESEILQEKVIEEETEEVK